MKHFNFKDIVLRQFAIVFGLVFVAVCTLGTTAISCRSLQHVSLQLQWVTQAQFAGYYVALDKGWYLEEGIDLWEV